MQLLYYGYLVLVNLNNAEGVSTEPTRDLLEIPSSLLLQQMLRNDMNSHSRSVVHYASIAWMYLITAATIQ